LGSNLTLTCVSFSPPKWTKDGLKLPLNAETVSVNTNIHQLIVYNVQQYNKGTYTCKGKNDDTTSFTARARIKVMGEFGHKDYAYIVMMTMK